MNDTLDHETLGRHRVVPTVVPRAPSRTRPRPPPWTPPWTPSRPARSSRDHVDELTGLGDRDGLLRRGRHRLAEGRRTGCTVALMLVDLDDFARLGVERTGSAETGDAVLVEAAVRLTGLLGRDDLVARLGRDEFVVLTAPLPSPQAAQALAGRVVDTLGRPITVGAPPVRLTASVGLALLGADGTDVAGLLRAAGRALCTVKAAGGDAAARPSPVADPAPDPHPFATRVPRRPLRRRSDLAADLRRALDQRSLDVRYQPRFDARSGLVAGFEARPHWQHPALGPLGPQQLRVLAERARLVGALGDAVAERALGDLHRLRALAPGASLSIGVCARPRGGRGLVESLVRHAEAAGHHPGDVVLDLTEDAPLADPALRGVLDRAHRAGLRVGVRGFGRASCGLRSLWSSPAVREVRIDPATVATLLCDPHAQRQVRSLVGAAREAGVAVLADGVGSEATLATLRRLEMDRLQGPWLAPALDLGGTERAAPTWSRLRHDVLR